MGNYFRKILHVDLDAFFCSVEELLDPSLNGKAFSTGGTSDGRGVVTSCSYAARLVGVRSAMPMHKAQRLCPSLITVQGHYQDYSHYSNLVMGILENFTHLVEPISIDEAFLDVSDLPQDSKTIALEIQMKIMSETDLPCSIGAASNKLVAKMATNIGKSEHKKSTSPMAIKIIPPGQEKKFLASLPIGEMWGVGPKSEKILINNGLNFIGDIQSIQLEKLVNIVGNFASTLKDRSLGIDNRPVGIDERIKSISNERTFFGNLTSKPEVVSIIKNLSEKVGKRLRKRRMSGKTVRLKIRWLNFETITRQMTLDQPTNHDSVIFSSAAALLDSEWVDGKGMRLIGVGVSKLEPDIYQLSLFDRDFQKEKSLLEAIDGLQERFGSNVIYKGNKKR
ncbi:MAG: DNA polymerase IV [Pelolinea sp.]|nr:DNA polymerase IV [Pelolinea sp.]